MKSLFLLFLLTSCAPYMIHSPDLVDKPDDPSKYSDDLDSCRHEVFDKNGINWGQSAAVAAFGLVGATAYGYNLAFDQVDDCLRNKGYAIKTD